ncbi:armadillo-type protein [Chaetomium tenue]|uniref:Armadillo-type protein n=1 Tax=Chaetomium tenue TaxID=1854479 RepID=A0ACB7PGD6_9PEZI|nr:armadillo-type protein [Chaetomium globosum]
MASTAGTDEPSTVNGDAPRTSTAAAAAAASSPNPEFDVSKLQGLPSEQQELLLLSFASALSKHVLSLDPDDCTAQQFYLKKEVFKIINLSAPPPTRVIRNTLGKCLAHIFGKGDRKLLFETVSDLSGIISSGKSKNEGEIRTKHAAVACLGEVYAAAGDSAINLHQLACAALLKLLKSSSSNAGLRAAVFTAFGKIATMLGGSLDENIARDVWKQGRSYATSDKGSLVVIAACRCLRSLLQSTPYFQTSSDFDSLRSSMFKTFDSPSANVRSAAADCFAEALVRGYSESAVGEAPLVLLKRTKSKAVKRQSMQVGGLQDDDDLPPRPESPAPTKKSQVLALSLVDMLKTLSAQYVRMFTSNKSRAAIAVCYGNMFRKLGEKTVENNYTRILEHMTVELLGHNTITNNRYRLLISRRMVEIIIQDIIGKKILGESGQTGAAKALLNDVVKNYPQALKEKPEPAKQTLVVSLSALASLINSLGSAANSFSEGCRDGLLQVLQHPSYTVQVRVLTMSTNLLKSSGSSELRVASTQIQVAWTLIGGLMSLGPNFVKIHLSQLLLLWKNALPKVLSKDSSIHRNYLNASFLTHVRECALGSILAFLEFNSRLLTVDVSKRIATMLQSTAAFLKTLPSKKTAEDLNERLTPSLQLQDLETMVQRRVLQCYTKLVNISPAGGTEALLQSNLLTLAISLFADPDNYTPSSLSASIANTASTFESVWDIGDNSGFGVTGIESVLEQVTTFVAAGSLQRDPGRKAAVNVNVATALLSILRVAVKETRSPPGDVTNSAVEKLIQELLRDFVLDRDQYVRSIAYEAVARLCGVCGNAFTNQEIKYLVDTIVVNREPSARAGCAMALGTIQAKIGSMAAGYHLKAILNILLSLCNDPHPTVHYWALEAVARVADASGLGFANYVSATLGMLANLYFSETHNPEVALPASMNLEVEASTSAAIAHCVDSLINVLGPDLQDSTKSRELILTLVGYFQQEEDLEVRRASLVCLEHLSLYAPGYMKFEEYVKTLQGYLSSENTVLRDVAVDGLHNLMKRNPYDVIEAADQGFEDQLWLVLDSDPSHDGMHNTLRSWMRHTCLANTAAWLARFQHVLKMTRPKDIVKETVTTKKSGTGLDLQDEEVAGFAAAPGATKDEKDTLSGPDVEPLRWQVTTFAMDCLNDIFILVAKDIATNGESVAQVALQAKIADVVRMAFSASTSGVVEQRIWGLKIIGAVLKMFGKTPDPDFEEAMLLEQYQAQISSALTPAFAADSSPELAAEAVNVCAGFIATGIVRDVDRMGRILKTLVSSLENFQTEDENAGIGDLKGLSSNARVMVKMAVFGAWAELQVASSEQKYLLDVLKPHIGTLTPLWLESLREFARLRFEPDISMTLGPPSLSGSLDTVYAALNRETQLKFYQDSWLKLVDAIASLIGQDSEFVFDALDGKEVTGPNVNGGSRGLGINYRDEPVAFFFVLFGIAFEALATKPGQSESLATQEQTLAILSALKKILHPSVSGQAIYREAIFSETMDLLDRLVLTEGLDVQGVIVEIARDLCLSHPAARKQEEADNGELSEDIEQLFELTRIIVLVLSGLIPNLSESPQPIRHQMTEEAILLIKTALNALVDAAEVFPAIIKTDLYACIIHIFATVLATPSCQDVIVPQSLPTLKRFITSMSLSRQASEEGHSQTDIQLLGCLRRFLSIYLHAQKREAPTSLTCVKNCLLALTILFTGGKNHLPASEPLVARFLEELLDCLTDRMTAKIAASCLRTLLLQPQPTPADQSLARHLLPRLLAFTTDTNPDDPEQARSLVAHALCGYVGALGGSDRAPVAMALVLPALLARALSEGGGVYRETSGRLLELASADQVAFRGVVGGMAEGQRGFLEEVIRSGREAGGAGGGAGKGESGGVREPSIALKMDFGGGV